MNDDRSNEDIPTQVGPSTGDEPMAGSSLTEAVAEVVLDDMAVVEPSALSGARLVVKRNGVETDDDFVLNPPCVIGRFDAAVGPVDVDLGPLPEGVYVSRKHARIACSNEGWFIEDLGSSNGTFILNDGQFERVETAALEDGTEFALGNARFVFHI